MANGPGQGEGAPVRQTDVQGRNETAARIPAQTPVAEGPQRTDTEAQTPPIAEEHPAEAANGQTPPPEATPARNQNRPEDLRVETREIPTYTNDEVIDAYITTVSLLGREEKSENLTSREMWALKTARSYIGETLDFQRPAEGEKLEKQVIFRYVEANGRITPYRDTEGPPVDDLIGALARLVDTADQAGQIAEMKNYEKLLHTLEDNSRRYYRPDKPQRDGRDFRKARIQHEAYFISQDERNTDDPQKNWDHARDELRLTRKELILPERVQEARAAGTTAAATTEQPAAATTATPITTEGGRAATTATPTTEAQPAVPTYEVGVAASDIYQVRGFEEAEKKLTAMRREGRFFDPRAILRKMALRTGYDYFREKLAGRARNIMWKNQNPLGEYDLAKARFVPPVLGWFTGGLFSKEVAVNAQKDIEEFRRAEIAGAKTAIHLGKTGEQYRGQLGKEVTGEIKTQIEDQILLKIAHGEITDRDGIKEKIYDLVHGLDESSFQNYFGVDKSRADKVIDYFASNIFEVGQQMKTDKEAHGYSDDQLREWTKLYFGNIKEGSDTKIRTKADKAIRRLQSLHLGPWAIGGALAHPATIGAVGSLLGLFGARGVSMTTGVALAPLALGAIPVGGLLAGSAMNAWRSGGAEAKEHSQMHLRETSYNLSAEPNAKVRAELQKIVDKLGRAKTEELINGGGQDLSSGQQRLSIEQLLNLEIPDGQEGNRDLLRRRWAEITARLNQGDTHNVDFITYGSMAGVKADRLALMEVAHKIKDKLQSANAGELEKFLGQSVGKLTANADAQKKQEGSYIRGRAARGVALGAAWGLLMGATANEGLNVDEATGGHVTGAIREHLPGFMGGRATAPEVPTHTQTPAGAGEVAQHGGIGKVQASLSHEPTHEPSSGLEAAPQNEIRSVTGPDGEWTKNSITVNEHVWEKGNDQLFHTIKQEDKLILDITRMQGNVPQFVQNGEIGFAFTTPDGQTIFVPESSDLVRDGRLVLDPNNFKDMIPGTNLSVGEFTRMVVNKDAFSKIADGDFASELNNHRDVFNAKYIEAAQLVHEGAKNIIHAQATIQGTGHLPASVEVQTPPVGGPPPGGIGQPPSGGSGPPGGPSGPSGPDNQPGGGTDQVPGSAGRGPTVQPPRIEGSSFFNRPIVPIMGEPFAPVPEKMSRREATVARQGPREPEPTPRPGEEGPEVDGRLEQMFGQLRNPVIENNNRYFVGRPPEEIALNPQELTNLEQRVSFFERHGGPGPLGGWKASEAAVPFVWDRVIGFGRNRRFNEAENLTGGDSGLFALAANAAPNTREQARLYRALSQSVIKVHENNPNLLRQWWEAQTPFSANQFRTHDSQKFEQRRFNELLIANPDGSTNFALWPGRIQELKTAIADKSLQTQHLRWIEFLSHSVKVQDLITKAQGQQRAEQAPTTAATTATTPVRPTVPPTPPVTPPPAPTGGPEVTTPRESGNLLDNVNRTLAESTGRTAHYEAAPQQLIDYIKTLPLPGGATMKTVDARISEQKLLIDASLGTALGDATFQATLINDPTAGIKVESQRIGLPFLANAFRGQIESYINNLNNLLVERINRTIDSNWETDKLSITGERLAVDFKRKGTATAPAPTGEPEATAGTEAAEGSPERIILPYIAPAPEPFRPIGLHPDDIFEITELTPAGGKDQALPETFAEPVTPAATAGEPEVPEVKRGMRLGGADGGVVEVLGVDFEVPEGKHNVVIRDSSGRTEDMERADFDRIFLNPDSEFVILPEEPIATPSGPFVLDDSAKARLIELGYDNSYIRNVDPDILARIISSGHRKGSGSIAEWGEILRTPPVPSPAPEPRRRPSFRGAVTGLAKRARGIRLPKGGAAYPTTQAPVPEPAPEAPPVEAPSPEPAPVAIEDPVEKIINMPSWEVQRIGKERGWEGSISELREELIKEVTAEAAAAPAAPESSPEEEVASPAPETPVEPAAPPAEVVERIEDEFVRRLDNELERVRKLNREQLHKEWEAKTGTKWKGTPFDLRVILAQAAARGVTPPPEGIEERDIQQVVEENKDAAISRADAIEILQRREASQPEVAVPEPEAPVANKESPPTTAAGVLITLGFTQNEIDRMNRKVKRNLEKSGADDALIKFILKLPETPTKTGPLTAEEKALRKLGFAQDAINKMFENKGKLEDELLKQAEIIAEKLMGEGLTREQALDRIRKGKR